MSLRIVFRVDASTEIGTGHVMRCLTLASELKRRGAFCHFICREHPGNMTEYIRQQGFSVTCFSIDKDYFARNLGSRTAHTYWLGVGQERDANDCIMPLSDMQPDWLVVDHYSLDIKWEEIVQPYCRKIMVVDDLADRPHQCDLILDQNLGRHAEDYIGLVREKCRVLVGPRYALLRPEFAECREYSLKRRKNPKLQHIMITMGGVDKNNITGKILAALKNCPLPDNCQITVIMGLNAPWLQEVKREAEAMPWTCEVRVNITDMAKIMANSDLCIGAAGSTSWERCVLGLPTIVVVLADNQRLISEALVRAKAALEVDIQNILEIGVNIKKLNDDLFQIKDMSASAAKLSDGRGVTLVANEMVGRA